MKSIATLAVCLLSIKAFAQEGPMLPRIENDTLITTSGYKIAKGMKLKLGTGTTPDGDFKWVRRNAASLFAYSSDYRAAANSANAMPRNAAGYQYKVVRIEPRGDKKHGYIFYAIINAGITRYEIDAERAIASGELDIPAEYKTQPAGVTVGGSVADEIAKLKKLKDDGVLTQEEFDEQKKKLLSK